MSDDAKLVANERALKASTAPHIQTQPLQVGQLHSQVCRYVRSSHHGGGRTSIVLLTKALAVIQLAPFPTDETFGFAPLNGKELCLHCIQLLVRTSHMTRQCPCCYHEPFQIPACTKGHEASGTKEAAQRTHLESSTIENLQRVPDRCTSMWKPPTGNFMQPTQCHSLLNGA